MACAVAVIVMGSIFGSAQQRNHASPSTASMVTPVLNPSPLEPLLARYC